MATHEIPQDQWEPFFQEFTQKRAGTLVEIESVSPQSGIKPAGGFQPLVGITYADGTIRITSESGIGPNDYTVQAPKVVYHKAAPGVMSDEVTEDEIVEITSSVDPPITYLRFKPRPEDAPPAPHTNSLEL